MVWTLAKIAEKIDGTVHGDGAQEITGVATLVNAKNRISVF